MKCPSPMIINQSELFYVIQKMSSLSNTRLMVWTVIFLFQSISCTCRIEKIYDAWCNPFLR